MVIPIPINLVVEDPLSDAVVRRLLRDSEKPFEVGGTYGETGFGYIRKNIGGFNSAARGVPFLVLTDLDAGECAPQLIREWLSAPLHANLIFRVAEREVESWLLAHRDAFAGFLGVSPKTMPSSPDTLMHPKRTVIELARVSRKREIRRDIPPKPGTTAQLGPGYNARLSEFAMFKWNPNVAAHKSPSLARALRAIRSFQPTWRLSK